MSRGGRRMRDIERRMRELDRLDAKHGLGAALSRQRSPKDWRKWVVPLATLGLTLVLFLAVPGIAPVSVRNAFGLGPHRLGRPPTVEAHGAYKFMAKQTGSGSQPVTWDPCRPIHYQVNTAGGPHDAVALVASAISDVSEATGLKFEYDGVSSARPRWTSSYLPFLASHRPVLVSWATESEVSQLAGPVAGIGGSLPQPARGGRLRYVTGGVTLDSASFATMSRQRDGAALERAIVLHELGHLVGLAHVSDESELMNADNVGLLDYGPGDREGLAQLGAGPCF
jgi:hypothetical protein